MLKSDLFCAELMSGFGNAQTNVLRLSDGQVPSKLKTPVLCLCRQLNKTLIKIPISSFLSLLSSHLTSYPTSHLLCSSRGKQKKVWMKFTKWTAWKPFYLLEAFLSWSQFTTADSCWVLFSSAILTLLTGVGQDLQYSKVLNSSKSRAGASLSWEHPHSPKLWPFFV